MTTTTPTDIRKDFENKIRRGIFRPVSRFLPEEHREERLQDAIAQTWEMYQNRAARGELVEDAILVHFYRLRATDPSRHFVPCEGYQRKRDVLDLRNYMEGRVEILHFSDVADDVEDTAASLGFAEINSSNPTRRIVSAISLHEWLATLGTDDRELIELRVAGYDLDESAEKLGMSRFSVCRRIKQLGEDLARHADLPDSVHRRKLRRTKAREDAPPESGVRRRERGRSREQAALPGTRNMMSRRLRRAA